MPHSGTRLKASLRLASLGLDPRPATRTRLFMQAKGSSEGQLRVAILKAMLDLANNGAVPAAPLAGFDLTAIGRICGDR